MKSEWRNNLREMLKTSEKLSLKPYRCPAGYLTIGYGHNLEVHEITREEAEQFLDKDMKSAENQCRARLPFNFDELEDVRKAVLVDMCFNMGIGGLLGFRKALAAIAEKNWIRASAEMLDSKWAVQVGGRAATLANMMAYGKWPEKK